MASETAAAPACAAPACEVAPADAAPAEPVVAEAAIAEDSPHGDHALAKLASEVAVTSETVAAVLTSLNEHLAADRLTVKTHASPPAAGGDFSEWAEMQRELQASVTPAPSSSDPSPPLDRLAAWLAESSRERPVHWTVAVFLGGLLLGWVLAKLG